MFGQKKHVPIFCSAKKKRGPICPTSRLPCVNPLRDGPPGRSPATTSLRTSDRRSWERFVEEVTEGTSQGLKKNKDKEVRNIMDVNIDEKK